MKVLFVISPPRPRYIQLWALLPQPDVDIYDLGVAGGVRHDRVSQNSSTIVQEAKGALYGAFGEGLAVLNQQSSFSEWAP